MFNKLTALFFCSILSFFSCLYSINEAQVLCINANDIEQGYFCSIKQKTYLYIEEEQIINNVTEVKKDNFLLGKNLIFVHQEKKESNVLPYYGIVLEGDFDFFIKQFNSKEQKQVTINIFAPNINLLILLTFFSILLPVIGYFFNKKINSIKYS